MEIRTLEQTPFPQIHACFLKGFSDYSVPVSLSQSDQKMRWEGARVNYALSAGVFVQDQLVGIIITGVDRWNGKQTAFNSATCMIPAFRGQKGPALMYEKLFPLFRENGIEKCMLEVIQANVRAVHVYGKIGFSKGRSLDCYAGKAQTINPPKNTGYKNIKITYPNWNKMQSWWEFQPSWEQGIDALQIKWDSLDLYGLYYQEDWIGYVIANHTGQIFQFALAEAHRTTLVLQYLFAPLSGYERLKMINVDSRSDFSNTALQEIGMESIGSQYEMFMELNT